jgi:hypothetical protein
VEYNYTVKGAFWMDYSVYNSIGNNWKIGENSPIVYFEKDKSGILTTTETYWDNTILGHSTYRVIYLRNSKKITSNYLNYSGSNGIIDNVWVSSSPAYSARQMEPDTEDSEYVNYVIDVTPIKEVVKAETRKVIKSVPYGGGYLGEIAN